MKRPLIPITERSNPKSKDIDIQNSGNITEILSECESEIFGGFENSQGIFDKDFIENCVSFSKEIQKQISEKGTTNIVLIGAGTSGRLCRLMAKVLNPIVDEKINIVPIIAGGIKALVRAEPNTEDKIQEGIDDYLRYTEGLDRSSCFVIGVSCGLSANYVRGALDEANKYTSGKTAIIGFNPIEHATVDLDDKIRILNPIIGPEPIVGSVRMKGGTTTMILIYALLTSSIHPQEDIYNMIFKVFENSKETLSQLQNYKTEIAKLFDFGNKTLQSNANIYLLGSSTFGALCIYDAAECPPTFGAKPTQVNGFSQSGVADLVYYDNEKEEQMAKEINLGTFRDSILSTLTKEDMILTIKSYADEVDFSSLTKDLGGLNHFSIRIGRGIPIEESKDKYVVFDENWPDIFYQLLFIRSLLGQLSTGSFILNGKVYENKMIDLRITNKKLFLRAIRIITNITARSEEKVENGLLQTIYENGVPEDNSLEDHITLSASKENIVPLTILSLIYPERTLVDLRAMLSKQPVIRKLIKDELKHIT